MSLDRTLLEFGVQSKVVQIQWAIVVNSALCYFNNNTRWLDQINTRSNNRPKSLSCINHHTEQNNQGQMMNPGYEGNFQFMLCVESAIQ